MAISYSDYTNKQITGAISEDISEDDAQIVEHQLKQILNSRYFNSAQQIQKFLSYIVRKTLAGQQKNLKQYTIAVEALKLPIDFDADNNPLIRIIAGRARQKLKKYYEREGVNDSLIISVPKGGYIPDFTKKGGKEISQAVEHGASCGPKLALASFPDKTQNQTSNRLLYQVTDILAMELSHFLFSRLVVSAPYPDKTQADHVESDMKNRYNADFTLVLHIHQLPRDQFELFYRLIDTQSGEVLCSQNFAVDSEKPIAQQQLLGKITANITDILQGSLHLHWSRKWLDSNTSIPEQYQTLVYYRHYIDNLGRKAFAHSVQFCQEALKRNPDDVIAHIINAELCRREFVYQYGVIDSPIMQGKHSAEIAVSLRPNAHETHFALGQILFCTGEWETSIHEFRLARKLSQYHAVVEYGCGFHLYLMGRREEGLALVKKAMSLSSKYPTWFHLTPFLEYYRNDEYHLALAEGRKITARHLLHGPLSRCIAHAQLGNQKLACAELEEVLTRFPLFLEMGKEMLDNYLGDKALSAKVWEGVVKAQN